MNCPYCGKEMELGSIQSKKALCWYPGEKRRIVGPAKYFEGAVTLSDFHITGSAVRAYLCRSCEKIVIDCADGLFVVIVGVHQAGRNKAVPVPGNSGKRCENECGGR